jgi:hypothetical protein
MPKYIPYMPGDEAVVTTGRTHRFQIAGPCMSVCFHADATILRSRWPAYVLESTDGAYSKRLTPRDDLVPGDEEVQLRFTSLLPGKRYRLTRHDDDCHDRVIFDDATFESIVDQARDYRGDLAAHVTGDDGAEGA